MQKLVLVGHIGNDAEVRDLGNTQVINFSLAVTEKIKDENKTTWYKCAYFTNNVGIAPWLTKGSLVAIDGKPDIESYTTANNEFKANLKCIVREIKLLTSTKERTQTNSAPAPQANTQKPVTNTATEEPDDLPF